MSKTKSLDPAISDVELENMPCYAIGYLSFEAIAREFMAKYGRDGEKLLGYKLDENGLMIIKQQADS